jgi:hypothetical protein
MGLPGADDRLRAQRSVEGRRPASGGSSRGEGHKTAALFVNKQCRGVHSLRALGGGAGRLGAARVEGGRGIRHLCALPRGVQLNALGLKANGCSNERLSCARAASRLRSRISARVCFGSVYLCAGQL